MSDFINNEERVLVSKAELARIETAMKDFYSLFKRTVASGCVPSEELYFAAAKASISSLKDQQAYVPEGAQPEGWRIVPVELTDAMAKADTDLRHAVPWVRWDAILDAAPLPGSLAAAKQEEDVITRPVRSDQEIVEQTESLAWYFLRQFYQLDSGMESPLHNSRNSKARLCWGAARKAQIELTDTDPLDAVYNLEEE